MKIGILTYHRSVNEGSVIQAYCLQRLMQSLLPGVIIEIIDYRPKTVEKRDIKKSFKRRFPFINKSQLYKHKVLRQFLKKNCILSKQNCRTDQLDTARQFIHAQKYDAVIVGSDTVWRVRNSKGDLLAPNIYYLPGIKKLRKIAFAVSFDLTDEKLLDRSRRKELGSLVEAFDFVSVRDETSQKYLSNLGLAAEKIKFLPDPTFLWDFTTIAENIKIEKIRPLAGLAVSGIQLKTQLNRFLNQKGFQVLNMLGNPIKGQLHIPPQYSLEERLGIYSKIDLMITDRFHQSIFCLKLGKCPVILLENNDNYPAEILGKGRDLFRRLEIEWAVCGYSSAKAPLLAIENALDKWENALPNIDNQFLALQEQALPILNTLVLQFFGS